MIISAPDCFNLVPPLTFQFHLILVGLFNLIPSPGYIFDCQNFCLFLDDLIALDSFGPYPLLLLSDHDYDFGILLAILLSR